MPDRAYHANFALVAPKSSYTRKRVIDMFSKKPERFPKRAGYVHLMEKYKIKLPLRHESWISNRASRECKSVGKTCCVEHFPESYNPDPDDTDFEHLVFALKYDGLDLATLRAVFACVDRDALASRICAKPNSKYGRRLFFFYEMLTGRRLDVGDLAGGYVPLLDPKRYFVSSGGRRSKRHRVYDNLLGDRDFCPVVRRTELLSLATKK